MLCPYCSATLPPFAHWCLFCEKHLPDHLQGRTLLPRTDVASLYVASQRLHSCTRKDMKQGTVTIPGVQEDVSHLVTCSRIGVVTYETVFSALRLDYACHNYLINELHMYYDVYALWTEYSDLLAKTSDIQVPLSQLELLRKGSLQDTLAALRCDPALTTKLLSYPGLTRWFVGCMVTMLLMDLLRNKRIKDATETMLTTIDTRYGCGFWQEHLFVAYRANEYMAPTTTDQEAIEAFIEAYQRQITPDRKAHLQQVLFELIGVHLVDHQLSLDAASVLSRLLVKRLEAMTKDYELMQLLALLRDKWQLFPDIQVPS